LEITLKELHCGSCRTVVSLQLGDDDQVTEFLKGLIKSNPNAASSLQTSMATITSVDPYRNPRKFRDVGDGIFEIKVPGIRLYCFKDQIDALGTKFILATNGGTKNNAREQNSDIKRAAQLRDRYFAAKKLPGTQLNYIQIDP
jgi:hypothetical protein